MHPLDELNLQYAVPPPSQDDLLAFQESFGVTLPPAYVEFLQVGNGATPEADTFEFDTGEGAIGSATVDTFYALTANLSDFNGVWLNTELLQETLDREQIIAIGAADESNTIFLDLANGKQTVHLLYRSVNNATPKIKESFSDLINSLR